MIKFIIVVNSYTKEGCNKGFNVKYIPLYVVMIACVFYLIIFFDSNRAIGQSKK